MEVTETSPTPITPTTTQPAAAGCVTPPPPTLVAERPGTPGRSLEPLPQVPKEMAAKIQARATSQTHPPLAGETNPQEEGTTGRATGADDDDDVVFVPTPAVAQPEPTHQGQAPPRPPTGPPLTPAATTRPQRPRVTQRTLRPDGQEYWACLTPFLGGVWKMESRNPGFVNALQTLALLQHQYPANVRVIVPPLPRVPSHRHHRKRKSSSSSSSSSSSDSTSSTGSSSSSSTSSEERHRRSRRHRSRRREHSGQGRDKPKGHSKATRGGEIPDLPLETPPATPAAGTPAEDAEGVLVLHASDTDTAASGKAEGEPFCPQCGFHFFTTQTCPRHEEPPSPVATVRPAVRNPEEPRGPPQASLPSIAQGRRPEVPASSWYSPAYDVHPYEAHSRAEHPRYPPEDLREEYARGYWRSYAQDCPPYSGPSHYTEYPGMQDRPQGRGRGRWAQY
ncbi:serine/arginine repetitive matrix protein 2-like [Fopius arisanus]|uniref:Serine/arginine repetitive matrix protein 2-like n=1 Tax=Fopius arisanus TaxID=64838 RepID=A0A9R1U9J6_9HYME|nr:PREDICTED: serine/arginine repetitive matrix protein 2-like [Fopius arisanus]